MKHWQEKRNYQHVRDEAGNVRSNIITVDGIDVEVSDEVYLAYIYAARPAGTLSDGGSGDGQEAVFGQVVEERRALRETGNGEESQRRGYCPSTRSMAAEEAASEPAGRSAF